MTQKRTYDELRKLLTFEERFEYLSLAGNVGERTFGWERYLNQSFYNSAQWRRVRDFIIVRDDGCDLGIKTRQIGDSLYIHHMNPIIPEDLRFGRPSLLDPDNLITVSHRTHNAIHYGDASQLSKPFVERRPGDTKDW